MHTAGRKERREKGRNEGRNNANVTQFKLFVCRKCVCVCACFQSNVMHSASSLHSLDYRLYAINSRWPPRRAQLEYNQAVSVVPTLPNRAARCDLLGILGPTEYPRSLLASSAETLSSDSSSLPIARVWVCNANDGIQDNASSVKKAVTL